MPEPNVTVAPLDALDYAADVDDVFRSPAYVRAVVESYSGYRAEVYRDVASGYALPVVTADTLRGRRSVAVAFGDYCRAREADAPALARIAATWRRREPDATRVAKLSLPPSDVLVEAFGAVSRAAFLHEVDVAAGATPALSGQHRRAVRKAERAGLSVRRATDAGAVDRFYALHARLRLGKFASLPQPRAYFHALREGFLARDRGFVLEALLPSGQTAAALLILRHRDTWYYKFGASDPAALADRPNDLLFAALRDAAPAAGVSALDLGLTGTGESYAGLARFKDGLGGRRSSITTFTSGSGGPAPTPPAWLGELTAELVSLGPDVAAADRLGALLYRNFL